MSDSDFRSETKTLLQILAEGDAYTKTTWSKVLKNTNTILAFVSQSLGTLSALVIWGVGYLNTQEVVILIGSLASIDVLNLVARHKHWKFYKPLSQKYLLLCDELRQELQTGP
jgi:hypothetical protein